MNPLSFPELVKKNRTCRRDDVAEDGSIRCWRDENQVHHVPKRRLNDLIHSTW